MKREAKWNSETNSATFSHCVHYSELIKGSKIYGGGTDSMQQDLSAKRGLDGAKKLLINRYDNKDASLYVKSRKVPVRKGCKNKQCFCTGDCNEIVGFRDKLPNEL